MYTKEQIAQLVIEHVKKKEKELDLYLYKKQLIEKFNDPVDGNWYLKYFKPVVNKFTEEEIDKILKKPKLRVIK